MVEKVEVIEVEEEDSWGLGLKFGGCGGSGKYGVMMEGVGKR